MVRKDLHEENRRSWNAATVAQHSHRGDVASFLRAGGTTLFQEERDLLGDIAGQRVAHLQCGTGLDTLSLASLGARVTGVDISDTCAGWLAHPWLKAMDRAVDTAPRHRPSARCDQDASWGWSWRL